MGRYTSNDNRSMQCNPNNERYYSSRGFNNDDDDDSSSSFSSFNQDIWEKERQLYHQENKDIIDSTAFNILGKKVIFMPVGNSYGHLAGKYDIRKLFELVLKEKASCFYLKDKRQRGLNVRFKSFKDFLEKHLDYDMLEEAEKSLEKRKKEIVSSRHYRQESYGGALHKELSNIYKKMQSLSFKHIKQVFDDDHYINIDVKRNYIYFTNIFVSDSYMIFQIDRKSQGCIRFDLHDMKYYWRFTSNSYESLIKMRPDIVYENFEDVFTCKKYLLSL